MKYTVSIIEELFPGFYNTDYDPANIERYDNDNNLEEEFTDEQYNEVTARFCEYIVDLINKHSSFEVIEWHLDSPSLYNYRNDTIWVTIDTTPEKILYEVINHEAAGDILFDMIDFSIWEDDKYLDAILEQLIAYPLFQYQETFIEQLY